MSKYRYALKLNRISNYKIIRFINQIFSHENYLILKEADSIVVF